jgi:hypothetical protein
MKTIQSNDEDAKLSAILREWKVEASLSPRFHENVWRRIETSDAKIARGSFWQTLTVHVESLFARPAYAVACIALFMVVGVTTGLAQAHNTTAQLDQKLSARYVQLVDPYQAPRN